MVTQRKVPRITNARKSVSALLVAASLVMTMAPCQQAGAQPKRPESKADTASPRLPAFRVAKTLDDGVYSGRYTVLRASGKKGLFYVFSDPACSYCRRIENELDILGRTYTIHIFPVTVVGLDPSREIVRRLMCTGPETRATQWREAASGRIPTTPGCAAGDVAIEANDRNFFALGFNGTPTIISENGHQMPSSIETAAEISRWLERQASLR